MKKIVILLIAALPAALLINVVTGYLERFPSVYQWNFFISYFTVVVVGACALIISSMFTEKKENKSNI